MTGEVHTRRRRYWQNGFRPLEVWNPDQTATDGGDKVNSPGKQPRGAGWQKRAMQNPPEAVRIKPDPRALNTGLLCEGITGVDIDVPEQRLADEAVNLAEILFGTTPLVRIGAAPKALLVYRTETAFGKLQTPELFLLDGTKCKVELLAKGQQFVADGLHPATGKPYWWTGETPETVRLDELPVIDETQARTFIAQAEHLLRAAGAREKDKPQRAAKANAHAGKFFSEVNRAALADIKAWVPAIFPRARFEPGTGAWRVSSADLGRNLEEDISVHPDGIQDFGEEEVLTAIDLVLCHGNHHARPLEAALWLCDRLSITPASLGYVGAAAGNPPLAPGEAWPEPAQLLDPTPTPPFPNDFLAGALGEFAAQQAYDLQVPIDFVAIPLLIAAAMAVGKEFRMAPKTYASWTERACLWGGVIGHVGDGKTPSFNAALGPIWTLQAKFRDEFKAPSRLERAGSNSPRSSISNGKRMLPRPSPRASRRPTDHTKRTAGKTDAAPARHQRHHAGTARRADAPIPRGITYPRRAVRLVPQLQPVPARCRRAVLSAMPRRRPLAPAAQERRLHDPRCLPRHLRRLSTRWAEAVRRPARPTAVWRHGSACWSGPITCTRRWVDNSPDPTLRTQVIGLFSQLLSKDVELLSGPEEKAPATFRRCASRRKARRFFAPGTPSTPPGPERA